MIGDDTEENARAIAKRSLTNDQNTLKKLIERLLNQTIRNGMQIFKEKSSFSSYTHFTTTTKFGFNLLCVLIFFTNAVI